MVLGALCDTLVALSTIRMIGATVPVLPPETPRNASETTAMHLLGDVTAVLMAKDPAAGGAKTRLTADGSWSAFDARFLAEVMLRCMAMRLHDAAVRLVLAVTPDGAGKRLADRLGVGSVEVLDQGAGDLGRRLDRCWQRVGIDRPVAFFGGDTPDVPAQMLAEIPSALERCDVAVGPTGDGGYWTLAAARHRPEVLVDVDWGSTHVYDQTRRNAIAAGLVVETLHVWHDVDHPADVEALRRRIRAAAHGSQDRPNETDPLQWMAEQMERFSPSSVPRESTPS